MQRWWRALVVLALVAVLAGCTPSEAAAPATGWTPLPPSPLSARHSAVGAWVAGRFVVVGGSSGPICPASASCAPPAQPSRSDGAALDPETKRWTRIADAPRPVDPVTDPVVVGGRVYLLTGGAGGADGPPTFLSYEVAADTWATHPLPPDPDATLVAAGDRVLAVGSTEERHKVSDSAFDPGTGRWTSLPPDPLSPSFDREAVWLGDRLLLTGHALVADPGSAKPSLTRLAVLDAAFTRWTRQPDSDILGGGATPVADRVVFPMTGSADGGEVNGWGRTVPEGSILDPASGSWDPLPSPPGRRSGLEGHQATVGRRTLVGGHLLEPSTRRWTTLPSAPWDDRLRGETVLSSPDLLLVWGGGTEGGGSVADGYLLRP